jgi:hypothetical protein
MTREEWLNAALHGPVASLLVKAGTDVPLDCRVSVGFPGGGSARKRIGECWPRQRSADKVNEIFISPVLADPEIMLATLVHEAIHASDNCASGHRGHFARVARACDLQGKLTATHAGPTLQASIKGWIADLPRLTHGALSLSGIKKQTTRMIKHQCFDCGAIWRASVRWEMELCPCCASKYIG